MPIGIIIVLVFLHNKLVCVFIYTAIYLTLYLNSTRFLQLLTIVLSLFILKIYRYAAWSKFTTNIDNRSHFRLVTHILVRANV